MKEFTVSVGSVVLAPTVASNLALVQKRTESTCLRSREYVFHSLTRYLETLMGRSR